MSAPAVRPRIGTAQTPAAGTQSATRVADVLLLFGSTTEALGVTTIARSLGLSKAVVHRILQSLASRQMLVVDETRGLYRLGPATAALGRRALQDLDLRAVARPVLHELQAATTETTTLSALVGEARVYLDEVVSRQEIRMAVELGRPFPLHAGASSKAILAFAAPGLRTAAIERALRGDDQRPPADLRALERELTEIRHVGAAISRGERDPGAASVAAPLFAADGAVTGAISACGPVYRFDDAAVARLTPLVIAAARKITAQLGERAV